MPEKVAYKYMVGKIICSGKKIEFKEYSVPVLAEPREHSVERHFTEDSEKRNDNLYRARKNVRQIIWSNVKPHSKFLTLTTSETVLDVKPFRRMLTTFFQAMKREGYPLEYLYVLERQKERGAKEGNEGSLHAHIIIFNDEFIPFEVINKHWNGITDIHMLYGLREENGEKVRDVGAYVCKYITKEAALEWGTRCFFCSKGLKRPLEIPLPAYGNSNNGIFCKDYNENIYDYLLDLTDITYENSQLIRYRGQEGLVNQIIDYKQGDFKG